MPSGGPAGASSNFPGQTAQVYTPTAQPQADTAFQGITGNFYNQYMAGQSPGQFYYPQVQSAVGGIVGNPYAGVATGRGVDAANYGQGVAESAIDYSRAIAGPALAGGDYASSALSHGFDSRYDDVLGQTMNNPFYPGAMAGAQQGAAIGHDVAQQGYGDAGMLSGLARAAPGMGQYYGNQIASAAAPLAGVSSALISAGFDPQNALYDRTQQRVLDQQNAVNSMSGIARSPYGAGVTGDVLKNFNLDWNDRQLGRQTSAAGAATGVQNTIGGLNTAAMGANLAGDSLASSLGRGALDLGSGATGLAGASANMPNEVYGGQLGKILQALSARNTAAASGSGTYDRLMSGMGSGLTTAANLGNSGLGTLESSSVYPYNIENTIGGNNLSAYGQGINLGNQQYVLPQNLLKDYESYLKLGQDSSQISGNLGNMGLNQLGNAFSGIGGLAGQAFGGNGALSGLNPFSGGIGSLFGGAGGDYGGGGAALGIADSIAPEAASSSFLADAAPLALSA